MRPQWGTMHPKPQSEVCLYRHDPPRCFNDILRPEPDTYNCDAAADRDRCVLIRESRKSGL